MRSGEWDERYRSADLLWSATPNIFVEDRLARSTPGVGLDLASGEGRNAVWLAHQGWKMIAVDFSSVAVERGREQTEEVDFVVADILSWQPDRLFDLVLIAYLHLEVDDFRTVIKRASTWLTEGGELFLIGHDKSNIESGYGGPQVPEILWDIDSIVGWLSGLNVVEAQVVRRPIGADGRVIVALDSLIRARR